MQGAMKKSKIVGICAFVLVGVIVLSWSGGFVYIKHNLRKEMSNQGIHLACNLPHVFSCHYKLFDHGKLEEWLFGISAKLYLQSFVPCDFLFNDNHRFVDYPGWLRYLYPIRLCPVRVL
jgi:hypothetical protein